MQPTVIYANKEAQTRGRSAAEGAINSGMPGKVSLSGAEEDKEDFARHSEDRQYGKDMESQVKCVKATKYSKR